MAQRNVAHSQAMQAIAARDEAVKVSVHGGIMAVITLSQPDLHCSMQTREQLQEQLTEALSENASLKHARRQLEVCCKLSLMPLSLTRAVLPCQVAESQLRALEDDRNSCARGREVAQVAAADTRAELQRVSSALRQAQLELNLKSQCVAVDAVLVVPPLSSCNTTVRELLLQTRGDAGSSSVVCSSRRCWRQHRGTRVWQAGSCTTVLCNNRPRSAHEAWLNFVLLLCACSGELAVRDSGLRTARDALAELTQQLESSRAHESALHKDLTSTRGELTAARYCTRQREWPRTSATL